MQINGYMDLMVSPGRHWPEGMNMWDKIVSESINRFKVNSRLIFQLFFYYPGCSRIFVTIMQSNLTNFISMNSKI